MSKEKIVRLLIFFLLTVCLLISLFINVKSSCEKKALEKDVNRLLISYKISTIIIQCETRNQDTQLIDSVFNMLNYEMYSRWINIQTENKLLEDIQWIP